MSKWPRASLGDLCIVSAGGTPSRDVTANFCGEVPWVKISDMLQGRIVTTDETLSARGLESCAAKVLPTGTVLMSIFATIGRTAVLGIPAATNQAIVGIIPRDENILRPRYLRRFLDHQSSDLVSLARGVAQANINSRILKSLKVPIPSAGEQERIADLLDEADTLRAQRRLAIEKLESLEGAIFFKTFGDYVSEPCSFPMRRLASLVRVGDSINYGVVQPGPDVDGGVPIVRVGDMIGGKIHGSSLKRIARRVEAGYQRSRLRGDEVLVSCVGTIGAVCLADESIKGFNIARAVARIPASEEIDRVFLASFLRLPSTQRYFQSELRTVSQPTLNIKQLSNTLVLLPPMQLQRDFADRLKRLESLRARGLKSLTELDSLFSSLQHRAFRGELTA